MQGVDGRESVGCPLVALHVQRDPQADLLGRADRVDAALGLAAAPQAALLSAVARGPCFRADELPTVPDALRKPPGRPSSKGLLSFPKDDDE
jgi:hypothetical protein